MPQLSAVVIAGEYRCEAGEADQEKAMILALGRPLIDYVLDALSGSREVSDVIVSVTPSVPLTESHVRSRGYRCIQAHGVGYDSDLHHVMQLLSTPFVLIVAANTPLIRSESVDDVVVAFYRSKKAHMVVGIPIDDVQEAIADPAAVVDMDGVKALPCGVMVMERNLQVSRSQRSEAFLVTDIEDFAVDVNTIGELGLAEEILRARRGHRRSPTNDPP